MRRRLKKTGAVQDSIRDIRKKWTALTWDDVDSWAGSRSVSRGHSYHRKGRVRALVMSEDGRLLASVLGGDRYTTSVWLKPGKKRSRALESTCTCPVGVACKHAVAVVTAFLDALARDKQVPDADPEDPRWKRLSGEHADLDQFGSEPDDEEDESGDWSEQPARDRSTGRSPQRRRRRPVDSRTRAQWDETIQSHIRQKSHEELAELVCSFVERFPELRVEFQERIALAEGDLDRLVNQARKEIRALTAEVGWRNRWDGEGHTPDYGKLKHKLERLIEQGHCDQVLELGRELIRRGMEQAGQSHDDGETGMELADCLEVVFDGLANSNLSGPERILYVIDTQLCDEYGVLDGIEDHILGKKYKPADWSIVADRLAARLRTMPAGKDTYAFSRNYARDRVSGWLSEALEHAGRADELQTLYEAEARATGSYERLVKHLLDHGRLEDAERWAREGINKTAAELPGLASSLMRLLSEVARLRREWKVVAAHAAHDFFDRPSRESFRELVAAAQKAKCGDAVRAAALAFLESGLAPVRWAAGPKGARIAQVAADWPLPTPDYLNPPPDKTPPPRSEGRPHYDVLLDMAIADQKPEDVLRWYDKMSAETKATSGWGGWDAHWQTSYSDRVAVAVTSTHPERALDIYRRGLNSALTHADTRAYHTCADYLRRMRPIFKSLGREVEYTRLLSDIRANHRNRPRFMEILDKLEGQTILRKQKASRRR